jgi:hypothetical protein
MQATFQNSIRCLEAEAKHAEFHHHHEQSRDVIALVCPGQASRPAPRAPNTRLRAEQVQNEPPWSAVWAQSTRLLLLRESNERGAHWCHRTRDEKVVWGLTTHRTRREGGIGSQKYCGEKKCPYVRVGSNHKSVVHRMASKNYGPMFV